MSVSDLLFQIYFSPVVTNDTAVPPEAAVLFSYVVSVAAIVTLSFVASGVKVILLPAVSSKVSVVLSATTVVLPTFIFEKAF